MATSVSTVNTSTVGTECLASAHVRRRALRNSKKKLAVYPAPRNAAVRPGWMVHEKYRSVWSVSTNSWNPARATSPLAT